MSVPMQFIMTGFTQEDGFRVFAFERIGEDRVWTKYTVRANLALTRRYSIAMQDLPLMCRSLLERGELVEDHNAIVFTEAEMILHAEQRAAVRQAAALRKKPPRRPPSANLGDAVGQVPAPAAGSPDPARP